MSKIEYKELLAFHPGEYLRDIIAEMGLAQNDFAKRLDITPKMLSELLAGRINLSLDVAQKLAKMLGVSIKLWLNLQAQYDAKVAEIAEQKKLDEEKQYLQWLDYSYFCKLKLVNTVRGPEAKLYQLYQYLKIASLSVMTKQDFLVAYRSVNGQVDSKQILNSNVWMQIAINKAESMDTQVFNKKLLESYLPEIRAMSLQTPASFQPRLSQIFSECGVAFVLLPHLKNSGVYGAVKWLHGKALLALNDRRASADTFWFSLFHEIKHVLQEKKTKTLISVATDPTGEYVQLEEEANAFARNILIPPEEYELFKARVQEQSCGISAEAIKEFAAHLKLHPGIVVGRLQYDNIIGYAEFYELKVKYQIQS